MTNENKPQIVEIGTIIEAILDTAIKYKLEKREVIKMMIAVSDEIVEILTGKTPEEIKEILNN